MAEWGYGPDNGPSKWEKWAPACTGSCQSPIDIVTSKAKVNKALESLTSKYEKSNPCTLVNTGRAVQVNVTANSTLTGGPLAKSTYILKQFHFHWGSTKGVGSEHTVDAKSYSAELHLVHWKSEYGTVEEAMKHKDGLAVQAVFLDVGESDHKDLQKLLDHFPKVVKPTATTPLPESYDHTKLLPDKLDRYWTYGGSLTTPPCLEIATFIIYQQPISVSKKQMEAFRSLKPLWCAKETDAKKVEKACLENNYRPVQPLNGRVVEVSFQ